MVFTQISRVVITTFRFPVLEIEVAAHSALQAHAERVAIARERPAHLPVPTTEDPEEPVDMMDAVFVAGDPIVDTNQPPPQKPLRQSNVMNHAGRQPASPLLCA